MRWILLLAVIVGCTTYGPAGFSGGYAERQINARTFEVTCNGNAYSSLSFTRNCTMRRAGEIALSLGYAGFGLADSENAVEVQQSGRAHCRQNSRGAYDCQEESPTAKPGSRIIAVLMSGDEAAAAVAAGRVVYDAGLMAGRAATIPNGPPPLSSAQSFGATRP